MDKAFIKGLRLIEALAHSEKPRGVTELAAELGLTKSNVHRLLATLVAQGYVHQDPQYSTYALGTKIWELGSHVIHAAGPDQGGASGNGTSGGADR